MESPENWLEVNEEKNIPKTWLRPHLQEIYDLRWSPDSSNIIAGSIDCKVCLEALCLSSFLMFYQAEILRLGKKADSIPLAGHTSFVQGVSWDPLNAIVVTQSADRSCRTYQVAAKLYYA